MNKAYFKNTLEDLIEYKNLPLLTFDKGCKRAAEDWKNDNPKTDRDFKNFYIKNRNYSSALAMRNVDRRKLILFSKIEKIIRSLNDVKTIVDYGCGAGSESMELNDLGYKIIAMDLETCLFKFFKSRIKKHKIESIKTITIKNKTKIPKCDLILSLDVLEHIFDPFSTIRKMVESGAKYLLLSTAFGSHRKEEAFCPWHTDFSTHKIVEFIEKQGYKKEKLEMCYPPKLFKKIEI